MARTGRKRKASMHLSGAREIKVDYRSMASQQPHRRWLPEDVRLDQKADSILGCLNLVSSISDDQYEAGRKYAHVVGQYRASINPPAGTSGNGKGYICQASICLRPPPGEQIECECRRRKEAADSAFHAVMEAGQLAAKTVARVAVWNEQCPFGYLGDLKRGLSALAKHYGLTNRRK